jgi:hypothetical protein
LKFGVLGGEIVVVDTRRATRPVKERLSGIDKEVFLASSDIPIRKSTLAEKLGTREDEIETSITSLDRLELIWIENDSILSLAIPEAVVAVHQSRNWQQQWTSLYS